MDTVREAKKDTGLSSMRARWAKIYRKNKYLIFMSIPGVLIMILFKYVPIFGIVIAFQRYNIGKGILGSEWVGFSNFIQFLSDSYALRAVRNTVLLNIVRIIFTYSLPIILALMLMR